MAIALASWSAPSAWPGFASRLYDGGIKPLAPAPIIAPTPVPAPAPPPAVLRVDPVVVPAERPAESCDPCGGASMTAPDLELAAPTAELPPPPAPAPRAPAPPPALPSPAPAAGRGRTLVLVAVSAAGVLLLVLAVVLASSKKGRR